MARDLKALALPVLADTEAEVLREILAAPALPFATTADLAGERVAALREALDYVGSRRLAADETRQGDSLAALGAVDQGLADSLRWHARLTKLLASLPAGRARNGVLGDIRRGDLVTWATSVRSWHWEDDRQPSDAEPIRRADAEIYVDEFPGLYDAIIVWEPGAQALIAVPTHRAGLTFASGSTSAQAARSWMARLSNASFHLHELIPLDQDPGELRQGLAP
jgi:hypothetical protein